MSANSIELPEGISERLDKLSEQSGRSKSDYVLEAIAEYLGDLEDLQIVEERVMRRRAGLSGTYTLDEVEQSLSVAD